MGAARDVQAAAPEAEVAPDEVSGIGGAETGRQDVGGGASEPAVGSGTQ
jgi:hypothetical protein